MTLRVVIYARKMFLILATEGYNFILASSDDPPDAEMSILGFFGYGQNWRQNSREDDSTNLKSQNFERCDRICRKFSNFGKILKSLSIFDGLLLSIWQHFEP